MAATSGGALAATPKDVRDLMRRHKIDPSRAAIVVHRIGERAPIVEHQTGKPFNPASLTKLPLTFAALDILGVKHRWKTTFAHTGKIRGGIIEGDLILIGGGDPYLTAEKFIFYIHDLRSRGIRGIDGRLIIDETLFLLPPHDPGAFDRGSRKPYNVGGGALAVNFNAHKVTLLPHTSIGAYVEPPNDNFTVKNELSPSKSRCGNWRGRISERYTGDDNRITLVLRGRYPRRCGEQSFRVSALNHAANAAGIFGAVWRRLGGEWNGEWETAAAPPKAKEITVYESDAPITAVTAMNKHSNNMMARNIFLSLASKTGKPPYTPEAARGVFANWMKQQSIGGEFFIDNGSGLSRKGRMTAGQMFNLMKNMWSHPLRAEIVSSLPVLGVDGTLSKRSIKGAKSQGHLKTGSLAGVKSIAGFLRDERGRDLIFICMLNTSGGRGKRFQNALMKWARALP